MGDNQMKKFMNMIAFNTTMAMTIVFITYGMASQNPTDIAVRRAIIEAAQ